ncbi:MAG: hypothetical protein LBI13_07100 [Streptococcaceae bacterium]|nr:hypothetical protein [Streptococcaceae bacterium]
MPNTGGVDATWIPTIGFGLEGLAAAGASIEIPPVAVVIAVVSVIVLAVGIGMWLFSRSGSKDKANLKKQGREVKNKARDNSKFKSRSR